MGNPYASGAELDAAVVIGVLADVLRDEDADMLRALREAIATEKRKPVRLGNVVSLVAWSASRGS